MPIRRSVAAGALTLSMVIGGFAGAVLFAPTVIGAQEDDSSEPDDDTGTSARKRFGHGRMGLATAAETIGIEVEELVEALRDGQSIAAVAEANDVDPQNVIDAMVADATERLEALIDELPDRVEEQVTREFEFRGDRPWHGRRGFLRPDGSPEGGETSTAA